MIINGVSTVSLVAIAIFLNIIFTADTSESDTNNEDENYFKWDDYYSGDVDNYTYDDVPAGSKRSRTELFAPFEARKNRPKYSSHINPIQPKINDKMAHYLSGIEKKLISKGKNCVWENFRTITEKNAAELCIEAWKIQIQEIPEIDVYDEVKLDCGPSILPGASEPVHIYKWYKGFVQYLDELKGTDFIPDLIRCNCATLRGDAISATKNSKRFFFLLKDVGNWYYVFTALGAPLKREVKLVNYHEIIVPSQ